MRDVDWTSPWTIGLGSPAWPTWPTPPGCCSTRPAGTPACPAAVPDTGPFNAHFVRDIGGAFAATGVALLWARAATAAARPDARRSPALFYVLHALIHVTDTLAGRLPASHWLIDVPGVYVPALVLVAVTLAAARTAPR